MKPKRSLVRIKAWTLQAIFLGCALAIRFGNLTQDHKQTAFWIAGAAVILIFFVKCEQCDTPEFWRDVGGVPLVPKTSVKNFYWPPKRCPVCGMERY